MSSAMNRAVLGLWLMAAASVCPAAEAAFSAKPAVTKDGDRLRIAFAVSAPTDVEVAVLDKDGRIVRYLAAGVLGGKNPPPEPLKPGLAQNLEWDGKDDAGKPAAGGPFKARVRAGMSVKFGRIMGTSPYTGAVGIGNSVAVAADGGIYVKMGSFVPLLHQGLPWQLRKFDKAGKYQKTLLPYAPSTDSAKTPGFRLLDAGDGLLTPANSSALDPVLFNFGESLYNKVVDGSAIFISTEAARMTFFKVDGSNGVKAVSMRTAKDKLKWAKWLAPQIAFSPDGKYAYYSNVANTPYDGKKPSDIDPKFPQGRVYRHDLTQAGSDPEKFYDLELPDWEKTKYWMPSAWDKKTAAAGVDVDAEGNLFVCDLVNQEVVKVSPEGKKLAAIKAPWPDKVLVSSKTENLYVVSSPVSRSGAGYGKPPSELLKIDGRGADAKVVARLKLAAAKDGALDNTLALDESGALPVVWLGGGQKLMRVEDRGAELAAADASLVNTDKDAISFLCYGDVDTEAELVYIVGNGVWRYNGETGQGGRAPIGAWDLAIGPGGMIYAWGTKGYYDSPVTRYTRDFKPAPLTATGKNTYGSIACRFGRGISVAGLDVDPRGWVHVTSGGNACNAHVYDAEGKLVEFERKALSVGREKVAPGGGIPALIAGMTDQSGSIRVDMTGNVYVIQPGLPKGHVPSKGFEKEPSYLRTTGTIHKFGPKGGEFQKGQAVGALRSYDVACGSTSGNWGSTGSVCHCAKPRFDVDGYGRLYIPNTFTYKVAVVDNADNPILSFGGYGNWDAQGPASAEPKPEIPLGWPTFAGASDRYIYVGDQLNHRVVRADKVFAAEETCPIGH